MSNINKTSNSVDIDNGDVNKVDTQDIREAVREEIGLFKYTWKYHDYIESEHVNRRAITELENTTDRVMALIDSHIKRARIEELERLTDFYIPHLKLKIRGRNKRSYDDRINELTKQLEEK